jgi:hypothetical protein
MEDNDTPPGFVKLQLLTSPKERITEASAVPVNGRVYISSLLWQQESVNTVQSNQRVSVTNHGPCASGYVGDIEFDHAFCIAGTHWPAVTRAWIERCRRHTWPPVAVLDDILKNGYHCVPVGSKIVSSGNLLEWTIYGLWTPKNISKGDSQS